MQEVEAQLEMQPNRSPHSVEVTEVESQPATETQTEEETRLETQVDEDDGEPVNQFAWVTSCSLADSQQAFSLFGSGLYALSL